MRRKYFFKIFFCFFIIHSFFGCSKEKYSKELILREELRIGLKSGDERYVFGDINNIALDSEENIYVLDRPNYRIQKFDKDGNYLKSIEIRKGQGPEEVSQIFGIAVTEGGKIYAQDRNGRKILVFDEGGNFDKSFEIGFQAINIIPYSNENLIILGLNNNHIFHIFSPEGKFLDSFGKPFEIPSNYSLYKDLSQVLLPRRADRSISGNIFLVNPHRYEIRVYEGKIVKYVIKHESKFFKPLTIKPADEGRFSMVFPWISVLEHKNKIFVNIKESIRGIQNQLDIFINHKYYTSLKVDGFAYAIDKKGHLYFVEEEFPKVVKYSLNEKGLK